MTRQQEVAQLGYLEMPQHSNVIDYPRSDDSLSDGFKPMEFEGVWLEANENT